MKMISFTIKTLDSLNHGFSVENETTVAQLKQSILNKLGIELETQRLIFCGRVLTDDQKLSDLNLEGKVIHLVPRPPPNLPPRGGPCPHDHDYRPLDQEQRIIDRLIQTRQLQLQTHAVPVVSSSRLVMDQQHEMLLTPVAARLDHLQTLLQDIRSSLHILDNFYQDEYTADQENEPEVESVSAPRRVLVRPVDYADILEELETLWGRFARHRTRYIANLRNDGFQNLRREERFWERSMMEVCNEIMHSVAHAYHTASDIDMTHGDIRRLQTVYFDNRHQLPLQAEINLFPARQFEMNIGQPVQVGVSPGPTVTRFRAQRVNTGGPNENPPNNAPNSDGQNQQPGNQANPEAVTYQVEIETRMPIALPLDPEFVSNLAAASAESNRRRQEQAQSQGQGQPQRQPQAQNQPQAELGQDSTGSQAARMRALIDIENLLRSLSQAHPGVEVVMSMEELHPMAAPVNVAADLNAAMFGSGGNNDVGTLPTGPPGPTAVPVATFGPFGLNPATPGTTANGATVIGNAAANTGTGTGTNGPPINFAPFLDPTAANTGTGIGTNVQGISFVPFLGPTVANTATGPGTGTHPQGLNFAPFVGPMAASTGTGIGTNAQGTFAAFPGSTTANSGTGTGTNAQGLNFAPFLGLMAASMGTGTGINAQGQNFAPFLGPMAASTGTGTGTNAQGITFAAVPGPTAAYTGTGTGTNAQGINFAPIPGTTGPSTGTGTNAQGINFGPFPGPTAANTGTGTGINAQGIHFNPFPGPTAANTGTGTGINAQGIHFAPIPGTTGPSTGTGTNAQGIHFGPFPGSMAANTGTGTGTNPQGIHLNPFFGPSAPNMGPHIGTIEPGVTYGPFIGPTSFNASMGNGTNGQGITNGQFLGPTSANTGTGTGTNNGQGINFTPLLGPTARMSSYSATLAVGPENAPISSLGPATFTLQPEGGVFLAPMGSINAGMGAANDFIHNLLTTMLRQPNTSNNSPNTNATHINTTGMNLAASSTPVNSTMASAAYANPGGSTSFAAAGSSANATNATANNAVPSNSAQQARRRLAFGGDRTRVQQSQSRTHQLASAAMVYDRFLNCESIYASRRLEERRDRYQEQYSQQMRQNATRTYPPPIYRLEQVIPSINMRHMPAMMNLLSSPSSPEAQLNAIMVILARVILLPPSRPHEPSFSPSEFVAVRDHIREYFRRIIQMVVDNGGGRHLFEHMAHIIVAQNRPFIERMHQLAPISIANDPFTLLRSCLTVRLPGILPYTMPPAQSEDFIAGFYAAFSTFYKDLCSLIMNMCENGFEGLRTIYNAFIDDLTEGFDARHMQWLRLVARENLAHIRTAIDPPTQNTGPVREPSSPNRMVWNIQPTPSSFDAVQPTQTSPSVPSQPPVSEPSQPPVSQPSQPPVIQPSQPPVSEPAVLRVPQTLRMQAAHVSSGGGASSLLNGEPRERPFVNHVLNTPTRRVWDEQWLPVFSRDQRLQRERQRRLEPYSDGYVSAMPARKRRCLQATRPPTTVTGFLTDNTRDSNSTLDSEDMRRIRRRLVFAVGSLLEERAIQSGDFDPNRYPATARLLDRIRRERDDEAESNPSTSAETSPKREPKNDPEGQERDKQDV